MINNSDKTVTTELLKALIKCQQQMEMPNKNAINKHQGNKYADLTEIIRVVRKAMSNCGLFLQQNVTSEIIETNEATTAIIKVQTIIYHEEGGKLETDPLVLPVSFADKKTKSGLVAVNRAQEMASAITYTKRYQLCALFMIAADDDDDNESQSMRYTQQQQSTYVAQPQQDAAYEAFKKSLLELKPSDESAIDYAKRINDMFGKKSWKDFTAEERVDVLEKLKEVAKSQ